MALTVEDGSLVSGAEAYASVAAADAYWALRTHLALSTTWAAATTAVREGALREAAEYLDGRYNQFYRGRRRGYVQGLEWPRVEAEDEEGYPLPDLPQVLIDANIQLAARAISTPLADDQDRYGRVKRFRERVEGAIDEEIEYAGAGATAEKNYGIIERMLAPILNGLQATADQPTWNWR